VRWGFWGFWGCFVKVVERILLLRSFSSSHTSLKLLSPFLFGLSYIFNLQDGETTLVFFLSHIDLKNSKISLFVFISYTKLHSLKLPSFSFRSAMFMSRNVSCLSLISCIYGRQ
jgi:hypothetical protein